MPYPAAEIPDPPVAAAQTSPRCPEWTAWLDEHHAVRSGASQHGVSLNAAARSSAAVTVTRIRPVAVEVITLDQSADFSCLVGGGSNPPFQTPLNLDEVETPLAITEFDSDAAPVLVPPGSFEIGPGLVEHLVLYPEASPGRVYRFKLEVEFIVDGEGRSAILDDDGEPFVFGFAAESACWGDPSIAVLSKCA